MRPRKGYAMFNLTTNDAEGQMPEIAQSPDELAREGARQMIAAALDAKVAQYVEGLRHQRDEDGHALVVRSGWVLSHGHHPPAESVAGRVQSLA